MTFNLISSMVLSVRDSSHVRKITRTHLENDETMVLLPRGNQFSHQNRQKNIWKTQCFFFFFVSSANSPFRGHHHSSLKFERGGDTWNRNFLQHVSPEINFFFLPRFKINHYSNISVGSNQLLKSLIKIQCFTVSKLI